MANQPIVPTFEIRTVKIHNISVETKFRADIDPALAAAIRAQGGSIPIHGGKMITKVLIDGEPFLPTGRFWASLYSRFNLNNSFFKFFDHAEVFDRISAKERDSQLRLTIERDPIAGDSRLLAATGHNKPIMVYDDLLELLDKFKTDKGGVHYHGGIVRSSHTPRIGASQFKIGADDFSNKYELHCPIDGFGQPAVYLSLLRWICSNGAVAFAKAFKTSLVLGGGEDNPSYAIRRALDSFTNDDKYAALRGRFEIASRSWASVREHQSLYHVLLNLQNDPILKETIGAWARASHDEINVSPGHALTQAFERFLGNPYKQYNADPHLMSHKRQRTLPVTCKIYDMLNFATELATHHVSESAARQLQIWVGGMLATPDFDLEESCDQFTDWRELFFSTQQATPSKEHP